MVFPVRQQPTGSYLRFHRFDFPTSVGPVASVAVPESWRDRIVSLYTLMLKAIIGGTWTILVAIFWRYRYRHIPPDVPAHVRAVYRSGLDFLKFLLL
jgi:hypothetical protein